MSGAEDQATLTLDAAEVTVQAEPETQPENAPEHALAVVEEAPPAVIQPAQPPAVTEGPGALLAAIVGMARDPSVDADKLEKLLAMQERMEGKQAEREFNAALLAAQQEMPRVQKNGTIRLVKDGVDKGSIPFATWEDVDTALRPIMQRHGFSLSFDVQTRDGGGGVIVGTLLHSAGHAKTAAIPLALDTGAGRNNLQAMGSTLSYGKRYVAEMLFNIVRTGADDDGKLGGTKFITKEQVEEISALVNDSKTDPKAFLEWVFGDSEPHNYGEITTDRFVGVVNALKSKQRRMKMDSEVKA